MRRARSSASHRSLSHTALLVLLAQVVASLLQRPELRPILSALVWSDKSVPVQWVNFHELNDDFAIFKAWPSEQNRVAATHLLPLPELKWAKEEDGLFYLARSEYDLACGQV